MGGQPGAGGDDRNLGFVGGAVGAQVGRHCYFVGVAEYGFGVGQRQDVADALRHQAVLPGGFGGGQGVIHAGEVADDVQRGAGIGGVVEVDVDAAAQVGVVNGVAVFDYRHGAGLDAVAGQMVGQMQHPGLAGHPVVGGDQDAGVGGLAHQRGDAIVQ